MRWAGHVTRIGEIRNVYRVLVEKPEGKRPLGRPRRGWESNIRMDIREMWWKGVEWIHLAQGSVAGSFGHGNEPSGSIKGGDFLDQLSGLSACQEGHRSMGLVC
jgi:hypothetical protein